MYSFVIIVSFYCSSLIPAGESKKSKTIVGNMNPVWNETFTFQGISTNETLMLEFVVLHRIDKSEWKPVGIVRLGSCSDCDAGEVGCYVL